MKFLKHQVQRQANQHNIFLDVELTPKDSGGKQNLSSPQIQVTLENGELVSAQLIDKGAETGTNYELSDLDVQEAIGYITNYLTAADFQ